MNQIAPAEYSRGNFLDWGILREYNTGEVNETMYFDTHAHYDDDAFDSDREQLLASLPAEGVSLILNPGCDIESSRAALSMAERYDFMYAAVGFHPGEIEKYRQGDADKLEELAKHEKCLAIGEIGLDYYWDDSRKPEQKELLNVQLELALRLDKPVIIHDREAHADSLEAVFAHPGLRGVFHCYSGSADMAKELLKRGWYLGFDGPVTYKNARKTLEVLEICPLDRILIETDSPYLSPVPMRGKRNNSANLRYICQKIAEIKQLSREEIACITMENGKRLFGI